MKSKFSFKMSKKTQSKILTLVLMIFAISPVWAAGGAEAIGDAVNSIKGYYDQVKNLIYAIGGVVGLVGGVRIYNKWQNGDQDINKEIMGWGGACIFLLLVPTFISAFFNS
ncbi:DUF4134 domain-containing protein [Riemerella columbipharyngis]|uniref:Uncharacterized protein n=1 Tax=Riemerella columbipharyngis TaxID=1071918 RepID=A0A1G6ZAY2_9FLAO|nr:DUF4134 domain-containing protein [Riemerella columbipharyngis]SDD99681.1 protein of unknown function [Riemerella columbipharyngis]